MAKASIRDRVAKLENQRRFLDSWTGLCGNAFTKALLWKSSKLAQPVEILRILYQTGRAGWTLWTERAFSSSGTKTSEYFEGGVRRIGNTTPIPAFGQRREADFIISCTMAGYALNGEADQRKNSLAQEREPMSKERERQIRVRRNRCHCQASATKSRLSKAKCPWNSGTWHVSNSRDANWRASWQKPQAGTANSRGKLN